MDKSVEWVVSDLLPSIMPEIKAQIDAKNRVTEHFELSDSEVDKMVCLTVAPYHKKGISLEKIEQTGIVDSLNTCFNIMLSLGIDLKTLGK
jgi:hypothetical protein